MSAAATFRAALTVHSSIGRSTLSVGVSDPLNVRSAVEKQFNWLLMYHNLQSKGFACAPVFTGLAVHNATCVHAYAGAWLYCAAEL